MRWFQGVLILVVLLPCLAYPSTYVCGDATTLGYFVQGIDPSQVPSCEAPFAGGEVPEAQIPAQTALYDTMVSAGTLRYLKVVDGLMVEKTQSEKDAVDVPLQLQAAATAVAHNEIKTNEVCANHTLTEITAYWKGPGGKQEQLQATIVPLDSAIAALATGPAKTAIAAAREAIVAQMTMFINDSELQWRYLCSRTFVRP